MLIGQQPRDLRKPARGACSSSATSRRSRISLVAVPEAVDPARYSAVVIWCETFSKFITAAKYQ